MDEVNINKYLGQFNPILIVPVLSAVVGAILVFVFGFKRPNEPRFQSNSSSDSLKKSKRKANIVKNADNAIQSTKQTNASSAKVNSGKKSNETSAAVKKSAANDKSNANNNNNNNNTSSNNNNINKKKTDEKKSENGSPAKKVANKKIAKDVQPVVNKKQSKANKNNTSNDKDYNEKPADFDDGGWFTVQSKKSTQKNKTDESSAGNQTNDNSSPKSQPAKNNKPAKSAKMDVKPSTTTTTTPPPSTPAPAPAIPSPVDDEFAVNVSETVVVEQPTVEPKSNDVIVDVTVPDIIAEPVVNDIVVVENKTAEITVSATPIVETNAIVDNAIAFDELGEWTDAKPDRKRGNKKKSRKD